jgi:hypothetical protein
MHPSQLLPGFNRADANAAVAATLREADRAAARGDDDFAFNLRADAAELQEEFDAHFAPGAA